MKNSNINSSERCENKNLKICQILSFFCSLDSEVSGVQILQIGRSHISISRFFSIFLETLESHFQILQKKFYM
jgi:hypothetical protein